MSEEIKEPTEEIEEIEEVVEATDDHDDVSEETAEETQPPTLEEQLEAAKAEASKNLDGWMRAQAEFANARKRMEKQRADTYANATADVVKKLLPVLDDFGRAMENVPDEIADNGWLEGITMVERKLQTMLENLNVTPIAALGEEFDPTYHEAIMQEESDEHESGAVSKELQKGYQLGDRVIRPSLVYVAM